MIDSLVAAGADADVVVNTVMDTYKEDELNADLITSLVEKMVSDVNDAEDVVNAYLGWLAAELEAEDSSVMNKCGLTIKETAGGWAMDFNKVMVSNDTIGNTGLGGLSAALGTALSGATTTVTWPNMTQDGSVEQFLAQWNDMQNAVIAGSSFELTFTVEMDDASFVLNVTLG